MTELIVNVILALAWCALMGEVTVGQLLVGYLLGLGLLWVLRPLIGESSYGSRLPAIFRLLVTFLWELIVSSVEVAWDVVTPRHRSRPGVIAVPLDLRGDGQITLLASLVSLTPGTLSLEVSDDRRLLYVHAMFVDDADKLRASIKNGMERRVREAFE